jgi:hypothetical protein
MEERVLWHKTRDLHHACENHDVGAAMSSGNPPKIWYAAWLKVLLQIHTVIDKNLPHGLDRRKRLEQDIISMNYDIPDIQAAKEYVNTLNTPLSIDGAIYVLLGAHLMGGEVMRKRLKNFPTKHLEWEDRKEALKILSIYRNRDDIVEEAKACFYALLKSMDEIKQVYSIES